MSEKKEIREFSCADCGVTNCNHEDKTFPELCLSTHLDQKLLAEAMALYADGIDRKISQVAASVEHDGYLRWTRVEEVIVFSRRMGFHKIGIATCVGLIRETRQLAAILRAHNFEVYAVGCKCGTQTKESIGCDPVCSELGKNMCNPILQAKMMNRAKTDFNLVVGLCVGHDSLFYKYSEAPVTTLVAKDRVLGNNPVMALYQADAYYRRLKTSEDPK